jgi:hypothetical protein
MRQCRLVCALSVQVTLLHRHVCEGHTVAQICLPVSSLCFWTLPISTRPTIECRLLLASLPVWTISCWSAFRTGICASVCCGSCTTRVSAAPCLALLWPTWTVDSRGSRCWDSILPRLPIMTPRRRGCRFYTVGPINPFPSGGGGGLVCEMLPQ